jgi:hypothetical protein
MTAVHPPPPMLVQLPARPLNLDDVAALAAADDLHRYELDEGTLLVMPPADTEHAAIVTRMLVWLSARLDRETKPAEYARAGINHFWRIERHGEGPTAHLYRIGLDERGEPAYVGHDAMLLVDLLREAPPKLT